MQINNAEVIVGCDVDNTLVKPCSENEVPDIYIINPYDNKQYAYMIHHEHVDLLRQYKGRTFFIRVWSAGGVQHAVSVVKALGLDDGTVDSVETKPMKNLDDRKDAIHIVGSRVFIPKEGWREN